MKFVACDFAGEFRLKPKAVAFQGKRIENVSFENLSTASTLRMTSQRVPFSLDTGITMDSFTAG